MLLAQAQGGDRRNGRKGLLDALAAAASASRVSWRASSLVASSSSEGATSMPGVRAQGRSAGSHSCRLCLKAVRLAYGDTSEHPSVA